jgi:hypothetical protein
MQRTRTNALSRFQQLDRGRRRLLVEAAVSLAAVSAALRLLPFRRAIRLGAGTVDNNRVERCQPDDVVWAIEAAARRLPWRTVCIDKGIAAQRMLRRRGLDATLHYGVGTHAEEGDLKAHVWVTLDGAAVIGGSEAADFAEVSAFR